MKKLKSLLILALFLLISTLTMSSPNRSYAHQGHEEEALGAVAENSNIAGAEEINSKTKIEVLSRPDCQHCQDLEEFISKLELERNDFEVTYYNIYEPENQLLWNQLTDLEDLSKVTPITLIGGTIIEGFATADTTGVTIISILDKLKGKPSLTIEEFIELGGTSEIIQEEGTCNEEDQECVVVDEPILVNIPFVGALNVKDYSLPVLSSLLGFVDGFNPCAMWVLVTFLLILTKIGSRKKMWLFAGTFILAEAIMYTLILTVWFSTWDFVGMDKIITPLVGLIAIGGGIFFLYEWKTASDETACKVTNPEQRKKITHKVKELATQKFTIFTLIGILILAFSVNIIEFACSIGIPQTFTKILEMNGLNLIESASYILLYILFYMIDDFIVFGIALYSFEKIGLTSKYSKWSSLVGGIIMLILGAILIFKPEILLF
jgi:uncharacterized protein (UPF0333 family)